ncbi:MAG: hypothetical protein Q8Q09_26105 [Deltaproteobacteria bacterium]|nr:hypothetical protein [Deltaproteobacteria bacterium]
MAPGERVLFREKIVAKGAFTAGLILAFGFALTGIGLGVAGALGELPALLLTFAAINLVLAALFAVTAAMFSVTRTMITEEHVHVHFGWAKRKILRTAIASVNAVQQQGFKQGKVSIGLDGAVRTVASTSASRNAIEIETNEDGRKHVLTVGTDDPEGFLKSLDVSGVRVAPENEVAREGLALAEAQHPSATRRIND